MGAGLYYSHRPTVIDENRQAHTGRRHGRTVFRRIDPLNDDTPHHAVWWVALVAGLFVWPSLDDGLVSDDYELIFESRLTGLQDTGRALAEPGFNALYRPVPRLLLALNRAAGGMEPFGYHALNALIHIGTAILLFRVLSVWLPHSRASLMAALFYAAHFVHVEPVYWVAARTELLAAFFMLLALWWTLRPETDRWNGWLAAAGFIAALLSNEMAVTFPVLVAAAAMARASGNLATRVRKGMRSCLPYAGVLALYAAVRFQVGAAFPGTSAVFGFSVHPLLPLRNLEIYTAQMILPVRMILDAYRPETYGAVTEMVWSGRDDAGLIVLVLIAGALMVAGVKFAVALGGRAARAGLVFAVITALPFLALEGTGLRYLYLPSAGYALAAAGVLDGLANRWHADRQAARLRWIMGVWVALALTVSMVQASWWDRAGLECRRVIDAVARYAASVPAGEPVYVFGIPRRHHGAYVFHNGFSPAVTLYGLDAAHPVLDGERVLERGEFIPGDAFVLHYARDI